MSSEYQRNEEDEEETEEVLMFVEFTDFLDKQLYDGKDNIQINVSNLMSNNPQASIEGIQMTGKHEVNLGTMLLFHEKDSSESNHGAAYIGTSNNLLKFSVADIVDPLQTSAKSSKGVPPHVPRKNVQ